MNQDDTEKNGVWKNTIKILIPALNEYLIKDIKHWAKQVYHQARIKVHWRKAKKIKAMMPIETAAYAEEKVFGNWRLVAPAAPGEVSPLQKVITLIRDEIVPTRWGEFRRAFVKEIKIDFNAICDADYDPAMVEEVNGRLNELLGKFARTTPRPPLLRGNWGKEESPLEKGDWGREESPLLRGNWGREESPLEKGDWGREESPLEKGNWGREESPLEKGDWGREESPLEKGDWGREESPLEKGDKGGCPAGVKIKFVLKPETAEDYSSPRFLEIRSRIWERFTGKPLDSSMFVKSSPNAPPLARQMEMDLEVEISPAKSQS
jgi:hypothetical protein